MLARELAAYICDHLGLVLGTDVEIGEMPVNSGDVMSLVNVPSPPPDNELAFEEQRIDFWVRFKNSKTGYDQLRRIYQLLHRNNNWTLGTTHYIYEAEAVGQIDDMDRDLEMRKIWRLGMTFVYRELIDVS